MGSAMAAARRPAAVNANAICIVTAKLLIFEAGQQQDD